MLRSFFEAPLHRAEGCGGGGVGFRESGTRRSLQGKEGEYSREMKHEFADANVRR